VKRWLQQAFRKEKKKLGQLNVVFCSDKYLLGVNKEFLNHTFLTDVITFHYNKKNAPVEGEIFISMERVRGNAEKFGASFRDELHRVIIHGVLHLSGYSDKTSSAKSTMQQAENYYLLKRDF
jgi:rRNA maturation RNase YbeY